MPRNGSGKYNLPANYVATTGETITAIQHNSPLTDIAADLNAARPIMSGGTGGATAAQARTNLGVYSKTEADTAMSGHFPSSSTDGNFAAFDGTDGDTVKDSGKSASSFATAAQGTKADGAIQTTDLASTSAGKGASLVGVEAITGITGDDVQTVLESLAAAPFTKSYESTERGISSGAAISLTHGLGKTPKLVIIVLVCKTAEMGYSVGDEIQMTGSGWGMVGAEVFVGAAVAATSTTISIRYSNQTNVFIYGDKSDGTRARLTNANWRLVVRAYA